MEDSIFVYELFNKIDEFPFLIVCIFHLFRNISRASEAQVGNKTVSACNSRTYFNGTQWSLINIRVPVQKLLSWLWPNKIYPIYEIL